VLKCLNTNASVDLLFHTCIGMERHGHLVRVWHAQLRHILPFHWVLVMFNPVATPALVVRRMTCLGLTRLRYSEDWAFLLRYVKSTTSVQFIDRELTTVHRAPGSEGGLSSARKQMRKGEFIARKVLLRSPGFSDALRFSIGSIFGFLRATNDIIRLRYKFFDRY
jgi:hypothetical protein